MMNINGEIIVHRTYTPLTHQIERIDYEWRDGRYAYIAMDLIDGHPSLFKIGEVVKVGPFRTKVVEVDYAAWRIIVLRCTSSLDYLRYIWHRSNKILDLTYRRLIITAAVWNLGYFNNAVVPSWRDLYIAHGIKRVLHR